MTKIETSDLLYGAKAIAGYLNMKERVCRHRIDAGIIPAFKVGGTVCARKPSLDAWLIKLEADAMAAHGGDRNG